MAGPDAVAAALEQHQSRLSEAGRLFVGLSGGLDSSVLLHALLPKYRSRLVALHADHGLQASSLSWTEHCAQLCATFGVPLKSSRLTIDDNGSGLEAAARAARYQWFEEMLEPEDLLLLAHHQDDQVETVLLRLLRGAGVQGLAGIPPSRRVGSAQLLRPLLDVPRSSLEAYAANAGLNWCEDPSNADTRFDRNYLRQNVIPLISERWPGYRATISRSAGLLRDAAPLLVPEPLETHLSVMGDPGCEVACVLAAANPAESLRHWLRNLGLQAPPVSQLEELLRQLAAGSGGRLDTRDYVLERFREQLFARPTSLAIAPPTNAVSCNEVGIYSWIQKNDLERVGELESVDQDPLIIRSRRDGDRIQCGGGHHRDLKSVFQQASIPHWWRSVLPLLCRETAGDTEVLVVANCARSPLAVDSDLSLNWSPPVFGQDIG